MKHFTRLLIMSALLIVLVAGAVQAQDDDYKVIVDAGRAIGSSDVPTLDPSLATDTSSIQVLIETNPGLSRVNEVSLETEPGVATWEVSDDGLVYTFSILPDISWVQYNADSGSVEQVLDDAGNVRYLSANDFAYGIGRSIGGQLGSYYGGIMASWVENGNAVYDGSAAIEDLGVTVVDDLTLEITASRPAAFLPVLFGMWQAYAQPQWVIEEYGDFWYEPETFQSYGPFALKEWLHDESITLIKNPFWAGTANIPAPAIDEVQMLVLDQSAGLANFEADLADLAPAPLADLDRIRADEFLNTALYVGPSGCTYMYGFNTTKVPTDDARVRRALSMTIDRQSLIDNVLKGGQEPAYFFSRQDLLAAAPKSVDYPDLALSEDDAAAQAMLQEYLDERGITVDQLEPITLMHNESEAHARIAQAIQQMWNETLGVDVQIQTQEWAVYLETIKNDEAAPQVFRYGWCLDYTDAHNFLYDVFHSSVRELGVGWTGEDADEFDALLEEALVAPDTQTRTDLYAQAEFLLNTQDAVIAPIYFYTSLSLTQPWVERTYSQFGQDYFEKWDIDLAARP